MYVWTPKCMFENHSNCTYNSYLEEIDNNFIPDFDNSDIHNSEYYLLNSPYCILTRSGKNQGQFPMTSTHFEQFWYINKHVVRASCAE